MSDILSVVRSIYDAALDPQLWSPVLERIADMANGTTTALSVHDPAHQWGSIVAGVRGDPALRAKYEAYYCRINPHIPPAGVKVPVGGVGVGQNFISDESLARTEYCNDFLKPQDIFHMAAGVIAREGPMEYLYSTSRPRNKGQFRPEELAVIQTVVPHLAQATRIARELTVSGQIVQSFESLQVGLVLVDERGYCVISNAYANKIFQQKDGLVVGRQGQLVTHAESEHSLLGPLSGAIRTSRGEGFSAGGKLLIRRPSGKKPYRLVVTPLPISNFVSQFRKVAAAIFVTDTEEELTLDTVALKNYYRATNKEAAVAVLLAQGKDLEDICAALGVRKTTARSHLRGLMQKVGVKRQSELVLQLTGIMGPVSPR